MLHRVQLATNAVLQKDVPNKEFLSRSSYQQIQHVHRFR